MVKINENFLKLQDNYLFSNINKRVAEYLKSNPNSKLIKLGIGDVTRPIPTAVIDAIKKAINEMGNSKTFRGYGPEQGYEFLRKEIVENEYKKLNINIDEVFVSDGAKCDTANIVELLIKSNNKEISINSLWNRRSTTKFNGVSYIIQRGAEAIYTDEGKKQIKENICYYKENAKIIKEGLKKAGIIAYGGIDSPYVWLKTPNNLKS